MKIRAELPNYCKVISGEHEIKLKLSNKREIKAYKDGEIYSEKLRDDDVLYETIFGWGVFVDRETLFVRQNDFYNNKRLIPISKEEYSDGLF